MSRKVAFIALPLLLIIVVYFLGPTPEEIEWSTAVVEVPEDPQALEEYVRANESRHQLKPDNEARIIWSDSTRSKTPYSVVYLHGFAASQEEGDPVHMDFAKTYGCNLYLSRLADHGVDTTDQLLYFTGDRFWNSAKEALSIGRAIGEKVVVMSTSTGGTVALELAAEFPNDVFALINLSPNIELNNPLAWVANNPWGGQVARMVYKGDYVIDNEMDPPRLPYWNTRYRIEAIPQLQEMLEEKMNDETFRKVSCPSLTLYYYKNEQEQDPTVKVSAMLKMHQSLGTPDELKVAQAIPGAGAHVIGSYLVSKDVASVQQAVHNFAVEKLKLKPVIPLQVAGSGVSQ